MLIQLFPIGGQQHSFTIHGPPLTLKSRIGPKLLEYVK